MVQQTPEAVVVAAQQEPVKLQVLGPQGPALAELRLAEALELQVPGSAPMRAETQEPQVPESALLRAETQGLPAQEARARLAPDGFHLQTPSVPA